MTSNAQDSIVTQTKRSVSFPTSKPSTSGLGSTPYIMPRQTGTGTTRGSQNISGLLTITDPKTGKTIGIFGYSPNAF